MRQGRNLFGGVGSNPTLVTFSTACDRMAEWSKVPDPSSGLFGGAGSNPAPVTPLMSGALSQKQGQTTPAWIRTRVARFKVWSANHYTTGASLPLLSSLPAMLLSQQRVRSSVVEHSAAVRMVPGSNPGVPSFLAKGEISPTRIRTAVAGFRVLSANHYTMGDAKSADGRTRTCAGRAQWISSPPP